MNFQMLSIIIIIPYFFISIIRIVLILVCWVQVHLAGVGDFQLKQIELVEDPCPLRQQKRQHVSGDSMQVEDESAIQKVNLWCIRLYIVWCILSSCYLMYYI